MSVGSGEWSLDDLAAACAEAAAGVLPSSDQLIAGPAQPGSPHVTSVFAGASMADLDGPVPGRIAVLVGQELVDAIANSPLSGLDLAAATQPALDAVANMMGARAQAARQVELDLVVNDLGGEFTTVPLIGTGIAGAVLIPNPTLSQAQPSFVDGKFSQPELPPPSAPAAGGAPAAPAPEQPDAPFEPAMHAPAETAPIAEPVAQAAAPVAAPTPEPVYAPPAQPVAAAPMAPPPGSGAAAGSQIISGNPPPAPPTPAPGAPVVGRGIEMLHGVNMEVTVELGRTQMTVRDLLALSPGAVLELDRAAGSPADLLVNGRLIARGEVVVVDEDFGLRVTEILDDAAII